MLLVAAPQYPNQIPILDINFSHNNPCCDWIEKTNSFNLRTLDDSKLTADAVALNRTKLMPLTLDDSKLTTMGLNRRKRGIYNPDWDSQLQVYWRRNVCTFLYLIS